MPQMGPTTLMKLFKLMKFRHKLDYGILMKCYDSEVVVVHRSKYLEKIKAYREAGRPIYWSDESWKDNRKGPFVTWVDTRTTGAEVMDKSNDIEPGQRRSKS